MVAIQTQDLGFLALEARGTPMHIGFMLRFKLPEGAARDFMQKLHDAMTRWPVDRAPFNLRIASTRGSLRPSWETLDQVDLEYHLRHSALPWPGGEAELGELISRVHAHPLDMSRPLWVMYLIEGLAQGEFALYLKIHHTLVDGVALMDIVTRSLALTPRGAWRPIWSAPLREAPPAAPPPDEAAAWGHWIEGLAQPHPAGENSTAAVPHGPACVLNGPVSRRRRFATQTLALGRLKAVARATGATLNDVVLAVCSGALRRYLQEVDHLPRESLIATVPVALPRADPAATGNSVGAVHVPIATQIADPRRRLLAIRDAARAAKEQFSAVPTGVNRALNAVGMLALSVMPLPHGKKAAQPFTNLTISNLPGPREPLYLRGAQLLAMYPVSVLPGDHRLNITVLSYCDQLHFGLIGCPDGLPSLQKIALGLTQALQELEIAVQADTGAPPATRRPTKRTR